MSGQHESGLHALQRRCYDAFVHGDPARLRPFVAGTDPDTAIAVYRNNALEIARKALEAGFPVLCRLVGEACFRTLSRDYLRRHPSPSGNLDRFGAAFPDFLAGLYGGGAFDYLADVARLEWACEEALVAGDAAPADLSALATLSATQAGQLCLRLHPSSRLVRSVYPVLSIWRANTQDPELAVRLDSGAERVLVARGHAGLALRLLAPGAGAFVASLLQGEDLATSCDAGAAEEPTFEPGPVLVDLAAWGLLAGATLPDPDSRSPSFVPSTTTSTPSSPMRSPS